MLVKGQKMPMIYWILMIPIFLWISSNRIFWDSQWQRYVFSEIEDFGHFIFDIGVCLFESFIYILLIWLCVSALKKLFSNNRAGNKYN